MAVIAARCRSASAPPKVIDVSLIATTNSAELFQKPGILPTGKVMWSAALLAVKYGLPTRRLEITFEETDMESCELFQLATDFSEESGFWGTALPFICGLAVGRGARQMLEIGVCRGGSTRALLQAAEINQGHVTSIDVGDCGEAVPTASRDRWTFLRADSRVVLPRITDMQIDFALIDGEHSFDAVSSELNEIDRLMAPHGCVVLDDCWPTYQGVLDAFRAFRPSRPAAKRLIRYGTDKSWDGTKRTLGLICYT